MADKFVKLPDDTSNTGKLVRTNERVVGANTVQEHFNILQDRLSDVQGSVLTVGPSGSEGGLVVRNIPSGIQQVTGALGVLVGGQPVSSNNPLPISGSISVSPPTNQNVTDQSGSLVGLLYGGVPAGQTNPFWITGSVGLTNGSTGGGGGTTTTLSGSVAGLLVGGQPLGNTNPAPVTGTVSLSQGVAVTNFPATQNVDSVSGSVTGLLYGGQPAGSTNPIFVSGAIGFTQGVTLASGSVTGLLYGGVPAGSTNPIFVDHISGSVTGLLYGGQPAGSTNPIFVDHVSGSVTGLLVGGQPVGTTNPVPVTGTIGLTGAITGTVALSVAPTTASGSLVGLLYGGQPAGSTNPIFVSGAIGFTQGITLASGSITGLFVGGVPLGATNPAPVSASVAALLGQSSAQTATWTSASVQDSTVVISVAGYATVAVSLSTSAGNITGGSIVPETSLDGGTTWFTGSLSETNRGLSYSSYLLTSAGVQAWQSDIAGFTHFRLRLNPSISGFGTASLRVQASTATTNDGIVVQQLSASLLNATIASGSVTGLLVGGQPVGSTNPLPVTGTVSLANAPSIASGSVTGLLYGGVPAGSTNPIFVSGAIGFTQGMTLASGSITGLIVGGQPLGNTNPVPITGSVSLTSAPSIASGSVTGLLYGGVPAGSTNPIFVDHISGSVTGLLIGGQPLGNTNPAPVTGTISLASAPAIASGSVTGLLYGGVPAGSTNPIFVDHVSGSVTGLLVGGQPVGNINPLPVTGTVSLASAPSTASGSLVGLLYGGVPAGSTNPIFVSGAIGFTQGATLASGSITGLLYGGVPAGQTNPLWVTGSLALTNPGSVGSNVTTLSGSVTGLLVGGVAVSTANPLPISGSISVTPPANQNVTDQSGSVVGLLYGGIPAGSTNPIFVSGAIGFTQGVTLTSGSVIGLLVGGVALAAANPIPVSASAPALLGQSGVQTVTWTSASAQDSILSISVAGYATVAASLSTSAGNITAGSIIPETSLDGGTTWFTGSLAETNRGLSYSAYSLVSAGVQAWQSDVAGFTHFRLRLNPVITGFGTASLHVQASTAITNDSIVIQQLSASLLNMTAGSGSVAGLLVGGQPAGSTNPLPVTGAIGFTQGMTLASGSVTGLLYGGQPAGSTNPIFVSGAIGFTQGVVLASGSVTGLLYGGQPASAANPIFIDQVSGSIVGLLYGGVPAGSTNPFFVNAVSGSVAGLLVGGVGASTANPVPVFAPTAITSSNRYGNVVSYMCATSGTVPLSAALGSYGSIAYIFHTSSASGASMKRIEIQRIDVTVAGAYGAGGIGGAVQIMGGYISAEPPGSGSVTAIGPVNLDRSDPVSTIGGNSGSFRQGSNPSQKLGAEVFNFTCMGQDDLYNWEPGLGGKPIVLRNGSTEGFEVRYFIKVALSGSPQSAVSMYWTES